MPDHNAKDILIEALGTIKATFWIQGSEVNFLMGTYDYNNGWDWSEWDSHQKAIVAELTDEFNTDGKINPDAGKAKVTGVCSIGALALANVTLYDEPLAPWLHISERDFETWKAGQALAQTICAKSPHYLENVTAGDIIATWNDYDDRTRDEVIEMFTESLTHPLLAAEQVYEVIYRGAWGEQSSHLYFPSEEAAQAFLDNDTPLRKAVFNNIGSDDLTIVPFTHDSQVTA